MFSGLSGSECFDATERNALVHCGLFGGLCLSPRMGARGGGLVAVGRGPCQWRGFFHSGPCAAVGVNSP